MHVAALLLAFAGFTGLCAAMTKHQVDLVGRRLTVTNQRRLRFLSIGVLVAAYASAVAASGWKYGSVEWVGAIMLGATGLTLLLPYQPRWMVRLALVALIGAALLSAVTVVGGVARARPISQQATIDGERSTRLRRFYNPDRAGSERRDYREGAVVSLSLPRAL